MEDKSEDKRQQANFQDFATVDKFMDKYIMETDPDIKKVRKAWVRILSTFGELW